MLSGEKSLFDLVRYLPVLSPQTLEENPALLVHLGIWTDLPQSLDSMWSSPRYFPGLEVLVNIPCDGNLFSDSYLEYNPNCKEKYLSNRYKIT